MARSRFSQYAARIATQGLVATGAYYVGSFLLPRLGVEVKHLYEYPPDPVPRNGHPAAGVTLTPVRELSDLTNDDRNRLLAFEGDALLERCAQEFANGNWCLVARVDGELASLCWISPAPDHLRAGDRPALLIRDCFTLPEFRGSSLYPSVLSSAITLIRTDAPQPPRILITSLFTNAASIRGLTKAGFRHIGTAVALGRWKRARFAYNGAYLWRRF